MAKLPKYYFFAICIAALIGSVSADCDSEKKIVNEAIKKCPPFAKLQTFGYLHAREVYAFNTAIDDVCAASCADNVYTALLARRDACGPTDPVSFTRENICLKNGPNYCYFEFLLSAETNTPIDKCSPCAIAASKKLPTTDAQNKDNASIVETSKCTDDQIAAAEKVKIISSNSSPSRHSTGPSWIVISAINLAAALTVGA